MAATKVQKQVKIIARQEIKPGVVVYTVASSNGLREYRTTLVNGIATGCTCTDEHPYAKGVCYHKVQLEAMERREKQAKETEAWFLAQAKAEDARREILFLENPKPVVPGYSDEGRPWSLKDSYNPAWYSRTSL